MTSSSRNTAVINCRTFVTYVGLVDGSEDGQESRGLFLFKVALSAKTHSVDIHLQQDSSPGFRELDLQHAAESAAAAENSTVNIVSHCVQREVLLVRKGQQPLQIRKALHLVDLLHAMVADI